MPAIGPSVGRYDSSVAGWSAVDKVAQFSHAVGRVSGGRGSAILIGVMDSQGQLGDAAAGAGPSRMQGSKTTHAQASDIGSARFSTRGSRDSASRASVSSADARHGDEGGSRRARSGRQPPLGVLLTTSHVLSTPEEAEAATVTFLDQLGLMTTAVLGHDPKPVRVPVRSSYGFVTSATEANEHGTKHRRSGSSGGGVGGASGSLDDEPEYLLYRNAYSATEAEEVEDVGFTLTYCDMFPAEAEDAGRAAAAAAGSSSGSRTTSARVSPMRMATAAALMSSGQRSNSSHADDGAFSEAGGGRSTHSAVGAPVKRSDLYLVEPLPVPLLLSSLPEVQVGDAHLMITHVNDGRRCYRVQHVAAVHAHHCEYKVASASEDSCSGGAVFTAAGDFIGIQHERNGHSICLFVTDIVRNLFESDLLAMCRSPISETSVKKREPHGRAGEAAAAGGGVGSHDAVLKRGLAQQRPKGPTSDGGAAAASWTSQRTSAAVPGAAAAPPAPPDGGAAAVTAGLSTLKPPSQRVPSYEAVFNEFYTGFDSLSHLLYAFPYSRQLLKLALESLSQHKFGDDHDQMSTIGGVGAILETIDGYPQDEAIVAGALAALCRLCIYERHLTMFLYLDGVVTTMEVMKEYVHQPTILQWGTYLLVSATDPALPSAPQCAELIMRCSGAQLFVNVLRVHGAVQRKSAVRHLQHNRLLRWTCDLIANLLLPDPLRPTFFSREDLVTLLLQLLRDYSGNLFLIEGFVHVLCVFVLCFADIDPDGEQRDGLVASQMGGGGGSRGALVPLRSAAGDPHRVSYFFLCQALLGDLDHLFVRSLLDITEAAMDAKSDVAAYRGRPDAVLLRCLQTLKVLLTWGLVRLRVHHHHSHGYAAGDSFSSLLDAQPSRESVASAPLQVSTATEELVRLRTMLDALEKRSQASPELQEQLTALRRLTKQQS